MSEAETGRVKITSDQEIQQLKTAGVLVDDPSRVRANFFDGQFLSARTMAREQDYFLDREASLARASGVGVVRGLTVERDGTTLVIAPGVGVTPGGELVTLTTQQRVELARLGESDRLDALFGLAQRAVARPEDLTGVFVLSLRAVEYTRGQTGAYSTALGAVRATQPADIVEATAVTLVRYQQTLTDAPTALLAQIARELFLRAASWTDDPRAMSVLPLAMVCLRNGKIEWVDSFLVRREVAWDAPDPMGVGSRTRAIRMAHVLHYNAIAATLDGDDAAAQVFRALPPAGIVPRGSVRVTSTEGGETLSQSFFPAEMDASITAVPEDELPALIEEALRLPSIDLDAPTTATRATSVLVVVPLPRGSFAPEVEAVPAAWFGNLTAERISTTETLRLAYSAIPRGGGTQPIVPRPARQAPREVVPPFPGWRSILGRTNPPQLWFVRRRNAPAIDRSVYRVTIPATQVAIDRLRERERYLEGAHRLLQRWFNLRGESETNTNEAASVAALDEWNAAVGAFSAEVRAAHRLLSTAYTRLRVQALDSGVATEKVTTALDRYIEKVFARFA